MTHRPQPTISAVVAAYQCERWIAEALEAILGQTHPPDEVVVIDDGSTDGTARELERFGDRIRVVRQRNAGCPAAFNRAFREARGDFVAMCGADDVWEPRKLEWQIEAIGRHPEADVLFGHAVMFGSFEGEYARPPSSGLLDSDEFRSVLYRENLVCAPSIVIRRELFERLGPFVEDFGADDYEYWMRCLRAGARFYYDPRPLLRYRRHDDNLSSRKAWMQQCSYEVHRRYAPDVGDRGLSRSVLALDLFKIGRSHFDADRPREARRAFLAALRQRPQMARALAWTALLSLPPVVHRPLCARLTAVARALNGSGIASPALR